MGAEGRARDPSLLLDLHLQVGPLASAKTKSDVRARAVLVTPPGRTASVHPRPCLCGRTDRPLVSDTHRYVPGREGWISGCARNPRWSGLSGEAGRRSKGVEGGEAAKADRVSWDTVNSSNYISDSLSYSYLVNSHYISIDSNSYELMG